MKIQNTEWKSKIQNENPKYRMKIQNTEWKTKIQNRNPEYRMEIQNTEWNSWLKLYKLLLKSQFFLQNRQFKQHIFNFFDVKSSLSKWNCHFQNGLVIIKMKLKNQNEFLNRKELLSKLDFYYQNWSIKIRMPWIL